MDASKPCPFCGSTILDIPESEFERTNCARCWASGPASGFGSWNDRTAPAVQPAPEVAKPPLDENAELPLEETINCLRCDGEGFEYHRKTKVYALNWLTGLTGAGIVVSSTWRSLGLLEIRTILKQAWGVTGAIVGITPDLNITLNFENSRGFEIETFLKGKPAVESPFVILDDDEDMGALTPWLVRTEFEVGLTEHDARKAIGILESGRSLRDLAKRGSDGE